MSYLLAIDGEYSGPSLKKHAVIELAGVLYHAPTMKKIDSFSSFCQIPQGKGWCKETVEAFWKKNDSMKAIYDHYLQNYDSFPTHLEAIKGFHKWALKWALLLKNDLILCSDFPEVDCTYFNSLLDEADLPPLHLLFGHFQNVVSLSSYHQGVCQISHKEVKEMPCNWNHLYCVRSLLGLKPQGIKSSHRAEEDALQLVSTHSEVLNKVSFVKSMTIPIKH
jgi:hypothetical protein